MTQEDQKVRDCTIAARQAFDLTWESGEDFDMFFELYIAECNVDLVEAKRDPEFSETRDDLLDWFNSQADERNRDLKIENIEIIVTSFLFVIIVAAVIAVGF